MQQMKVFTMIKFIGSLLTIVALCVFATQPSWAQVSAGSEAGSKSASGAIAGAQINIGGGAADGGRSVPAIGSTLDYSVESTTYANPVDLARGVPNMWAPGLGGGGSNPCVVSISGAGVGSGLGISFGRSWNDEECQVRETMRVVGGQLNAKNPQAQVLQKNIACQSEIIQKAMRETAAEAGDSSIRCYNDKAPTRRVSQSPTITPAVASSYADAVGKCRTVKDTKYGSCMKDARRLL